MNLQPHTYAMLKVALLSLRHPENPEPRITRAELFGMGLALMSAGLISHRQLQTLNELSSNAASYQLIKKPWPAGPWLPF